MRKIFSFLTAILASVTLASALEITVPATTLDLQDPSIVTTAGWTGEKAYYLDDDVLIVSGYEAYKSVAKQTWITFLSTGSSSSTWSALEPFKGSDYYTTKSYATLQSNRYTAYLVTNCDSVWAYGCNNANTAKYLVMNVYEITGEVATINTESVEPTYSVSNEAAGKADVVLKQALDATKKYLVVTTGAGAANSRSYETAFFRHSDATPKTSWTVAGSSATVFGTAWDPTNKANDMKKQADGSYKWEKTELELAAGSVDFKVCKDHAWDEAYPASNYNLAITEAGIYTITINFNESTKEVSAVATKTGEAVVVPTVVLHGNFGGTWADTDPFATATDKLTAALRLTLAEGTYEFGFKFDGTWKANGANITREANTANLATGEGNMHITADQAGEYEFVYTFETQGVVVTYPKKQTAGAYTLTFKGTGTSSDASGVLKDSVGAVFTDDCQDKVASVDSLSNVYAGRNIVDETSLKFGTSSKKGALVFTLATPVEVDSIIVNATQYGNDAAEVTINGIKFDLTAGNKVPTDCKLVPNGVVSQISILQTGAQRIYLRHVTIYAKTGPTPPPADPTVSAYGTMTNPAWEVEVPFTLAADKKSASFTANIAKGDYNFKLVVNGEWRSNGYTYHREFTGAAGITGNNDNNMIFQADVTGDYTITWTFENDSLGITFPAKPEPVLENGYYLVGDKYNWTPAAARKFIQNPENALEFLLADVTLAADDSLKVVKVVDDEIDAWYPGGDNYVVDANHAGVKTIYFRPDGQGGEGWFAGTIYIAPNGTVGITNTEAEKKAVKTLRNGILVIEKNGKAYNVIGLQIR